MKPLMFDFYKDNLTSDSFEQDCDMYYAMYAYETYGDATRDNTYSELVELGRELVSFENGEIA